MAADEARIEALEQADRQRSALLRSVSHDLRTPLATIRAVATDLHGEVPFEPATRHELLGLVIDEVERLDRIVANLLSLSRIEAGAFLPDRQAVDVGELVEACTARLGRVLDRVRAATSTSTPTSRWSTSTTASSTRCCRTCSRTRPATRPTGGVVEVGSHAVAEPLATAGDRPRLRAVRRGPRPAVRAVRLGDRQRARAASVWRSVAASSRLMVAPSPHPTPRAAAPRFTVEVPDRV